MIKKLILLIGLPAVGKSTWVNKFLKHNTDTIVCGLDLFLEQEYPQFSTYVEKFNHHQKLGDIGFDNYIKYMDSCKKEALKKGYNLIIDQTNLNKKARARHLSLPAKEKIAVFWRNTPKDWKKRLERRSRKEGKFIPKEVLKSMANSLEEPSFKEGFDKIIINPL